MKKSNKVLLLFAVLFLTYFSIVLSLFLRNFLFTILQPGVVAGLIPYFILKNKWEIIIENDINWYNYIGIFITFIGLLIVFYCIFDFAIKGKGTLSPADKTKQLVISGFYKYSRNPIYVGVVLILIGETFFFISIELAIYTFIVFVGFHFFVIFVEEPRLKKDFKEQYTQYIHNINRWF